MKKTFLLFLIFTMLAWSFGLFSPILAKAANTIPTGTLIKGATNPTIYYLAEDGKRYVFPNANTYFSWFDDFKQIVSVSDETLASYPLGGNVQYKPGVILVKIQTDPKVYLVSNNGTLRWVKSEAIARALYGKNWNKLIDDLPDSFFTNYRAGDPVAGEDDINLTELEDEYPSISHNFGFKIKAKILNRIANQVEKRCVNLEEAVNKLQKRLSRWHMAMAGVGDDFVAECVEKNILTLKGNRGKDKITLCHILKEDDDRDKKKTITVGSPAVKAHLAHGDTLGECSGSGGTDTAAPVISAVNSMAGCATSSINWTTNELATSKAYYSSNPIASSTGITAIENNSLVTSHSLSLTGLATSTKYYFKVESSDAAGNKATSTESFFTTTSCADVIAPIISAVNSVASSTTAAVNWTTNELATSKAYYSLNPIASSTGITAIENSSLVTAHALGLIGLATSTKYYFKAESSDAAGNQASSSELFFTTLGE